MATLVDTSADLPPIRDRLHVQWAHDLLAGLVVGDTADLVLLFGVMDRQDKVAMKLALDTLCWVLQHDHNDTFPENLAKIYDAVRVIAKFPKPPWEE